MMSREWLSWGARCKGDDSEPHLKYTVAIEMPSTVLCIKPAGTPGEVLHSAVLARAADTEHCTAVTFRVCIR